MSEALAHQSAALTFLRQGRIEEAMRSALAALTLSPELVEARYILGECHGVQGRFDELIRAMETVIRLDPGHGAAHHALGIGYTQLGMLPRAAEAYQRACVLLGEPPASLFGLGVVLGRLGDYGRAAQLLERVVQRAPLMAEAWRGLGMATARLGELTRAVAALQRAVELAPGASAAWHELGIALQRIDEMERAVAALRQAVALAPGNAEMRCALAVALQGIGRNQQAAEEYREALRLRPDWEQARFWLAAVGGATAPATAPASYVREHFDDYAETFERYLVEVLAYRVPEQLVALAVRTAADVPLVVFDAGCGTGLCGQYVRPHASRLIGVDLAPRMIEQSRRRGIYDELIEGELHEALRRFAGSIDLILAADVMIYVGEAGPLFEAAAVALRPGGLLAVSIEGIEGEGYVLRPTRRYAHSRAYLERLAAAHAFEEACAATTVIRKESNQDVPGWLLVWRKR